MKLYYYSLKRVLVILFLDDIKDLLPPKDFNRLKHEKAHNIVGRTIVPFQIRFP